MRSHRHISHTLFKRSTTSSCSDLKSSTYSINGATFDVLCGTGFSYEGYLEVVYQETFTDCVASCATYESTAQCIGIQYDPSVPGPNGLNLCYLLWNVTGTSGNGSSTVDSARLRPPVLVLYVSSRVINISNPRVNPGIILPRQERYSKMCATMIFTPKTFILPTQETLLHALIIAHYGT